MKLNFIYLILIIIILNSEYTQGQKIEIYSDWSLKVSSSDILDAGMDYPTNYMSKTGKIKFDITHNKSKERNGYDWSISIQKSDLFWDNQLKIFARRTSDGFAYSNASYAHSVDGGEVFQEIEDFNQFFFSGLRGHTDMKIQYKLKGISVLIPAEKYETEIIYTISAP
ncbi:MAG: hypothetical protein ACERIH_11455 [Labilibaculum antarcticum]